MTKFYCDKDALREAVLMACRAVPNKSNIPVLECVVLEAGEDSVTVTGYDLKIAIRAKTDAEVQEQGVVALNAKLFSDIIRKMPEGELFFSADNSGATEIKCGNAHFHIAGLDTKDYPELPTVDGKHSVLINEMALKAAISGTVFAVSTNEARPAQCGVLFDISAQKGKANLVACDGFRLALMREELNAKEDVEFVVPGGTLSEIERFCADPEGIVSISVGERHLLFSIGSTEIISRRLEGQFLDYKNVLPKNNNIEIEVDSKGIMQSIERVSVVVNEKLKSPLRMAIDGSKVTLSAKTAIGSASDSFEVSGGGELEIGFNGRFLYESIKHAPVDTVKMSFGGATLPSLITAPNGEGNFIYMVLPVRLKQE